MGNNVSIKRNGNQIVVAVSGSLDEESALTAGAFQGATSVVFDFKELQNINSCGIREWIQWITPLSQTQVVYRHCPKVIVDQINMIDGFLPASGVVESFYVPYYSDASGEEKHVLFTSGKEFSGESLRLPDNVKDSKNNSMEIDVIESKYFRFLSKKSQAA